jgi:RimJ/RimL family protein N-acetyltransferase
LIRPWDRADAPAVVAAYRDREIQQWHARTMTDAEALQWVLSWPERWSAETGAGWAVVEAGALVARVGFGGLTLADGLGEAAYWVVPAARGRGIAARALSAVTDWMFEQVGFHRMVLHHSTRNLASCRVADKTGYAHEGTAVQQALHADGWHDMHVHARVRDEGGRWPGSRRSSMPAERRELARHDG